MEPDKKGNSQPDNINQKNITNNQSNKKEVLVNQNNNEENPKLYDDISTLIKDIPLNNLNDYYDIETNLFKKRIEKLNLKFYWIYESILGEESNNKLIYPYNKLFLILFKEISLYIEEILRLNKQLNSKSKNEKFYLQKINDYKQKEKDFLINKQEVKNLQRVIRNLEKKNEKLNNEIEKLKKKIFNVNSPTRSYFSNFKSYKSNVLNSAKYNKFNKTSNMYYSGNVTEQGSVMSSISNKISNKTFVNKNHVSKGKIGTNRVHSNSNLKTQNKNMPLDNEKDFINIGIEQCEDEINNLNLIENLLMKSYDNKKKGFNKGKHKSYKKFTPEKYSINNQASYTSYKKNIFANNRYKKSNKSIDFKVGSVSSNNKI